GVVGHHASPVAGSEPGPCWTAEGRYTVKVEPSPYTLVTVRSPSIRRQNCRLIARPSPVPPYLLLVLASAWENASNSRPSCSLVIPMPVSETAKEMQSACARVTVNLIVPWSVNLAALDSRLNSVWRTLVWSACIDPRSS